MYVVCGNIFYAVIFILFETFLSLIKEKSFFKQSRLPLSVSLWLVERLVYCRSRSYTCEKTVIVGR